MHCPGRCCPGCPYLIGGPSPVVGGKLVPLSAAASLAADSSRWAGKVCAIGRTLTACSTYTNSVKEKPLSVLVAKLQGSMRPRL